MCGWIERPPSTEIELHDISVFQSSRAEVVIDRPRLDLISAQMNDKVKERGNHLEQKTSSFGHTRFSEVSSLKHRTF